MGANIVIGFVNDSLNTIYRNYENLIQFLKNNSLSIEYIKYCKDKDGDSWICIESEVDKTALSLKECIMDTHFFEMYVLKFPIGQIKEDVLIRICIHEQNFYSLTIEVQEEKVLNSYKVHELIALEKNIEEVIKIMMRELNIDYAFSDQDAEAEYSLKDILNHINPHYALEVTTDKKGNLKVSKASWYVNGTTPR